MMAHFVAFEQNKLHQIFKTASMIPKRLNCAFLSFLQVFCHVLSLHFKFGWLKRTFLEYRILPVFVFHHTTKGPAILQGRDNLAYGWGAGNLN